MEIGYYDQEHHVLHDEKTLFEEISDEYPYLDNTRIRNVLAAFLFTGDDVFKRIADLSGGEKGRVSLAKLMLSNANFLILDEPTNHLDIMSKEILEDALNHYEGTVLYVSHDRYFINKTAHRILELSGGDFTNYLGNYDYYLLKKEQLAVNTPAASAAAPTEDTESKTDWKQQKEEQAQKRKKENDLKKCEQRIEKLEEEKASLEEKMCDPSIATDVGKLQELSKKSKKRTDSFQKRTKNGKGLRNKPQAFFLHILHIFSYIASYVLRISLIKFSLFNTVTSFKEVIRARSLVILPLSMVERVAFSSLSANSTSSLMPSNSPRFLNAPVHAKMVATEFVEVSSPFKCL